MVKGPYAFLSFTRYKIFSKNPQTVNYDKLAAINQGPLENPTAFLERLLEAIIKYTNPDLKDPAGKIILKDKFITQLVLDIRRKL